MKCREVKKALVAYLDGEIMPSERTLMEAHLAGCPTCEQELSSLSAGRRRVTDSLKALGAEAGPSPQAAMRLQSSIAAPAARSRDQSKEKGGSPMRLRWRIALGTACAVVLAAAVVAAVPSSRAAAGGFFADVFNIQVGPMVKLAYVPAGFAQEPEAVTGMASISAGAESAQMEEQQLYKNGDQFLLVKTSTDDGSPLPQGEAAKVNGRAAVLSTGLSGAVDMAPAVPEGADASGAAVEGAASEGAASGGTQIVTASGAAAGEPAPPEAGSGAVTVTGSGSGPSLQTSGSPGSLPELPSVSYEDAISLTWVVDGTRVELLSNLPATELQKIAEGLTLNT